jgi:hypothetical protein
MKTDIDQKQVIDILTTHGPAKSAWDEPISAVVQAAGLPTMEARLYVEDLRNRSLVVPRSRVVHGPFYNATFEWVRP